MSRAFVKETDGEEPGDLPERRISPHPNLVTTRGLRLIEESLARLESEHAAARSAGDRAAMARAARDLRYWRARRDSARLAPPPEPGTIGFGARVTFVDPQGHRRTYRLVGEDEADPADGRISWVAPLARALTGRRVGDVAAGPRGDLEIVEIDADPET
jgi:transcription elongation GreA/GreB family factor